MDVTSHQMHNVLNVYSRQLSRAAISGKKQKLLMTPATNHADLTPEGKRQTTIEKVTKNIFEKITQFGSRFEEKHEFLKKGISTKGDNHELGRKKDTTFVFNSIDNVNEKRTNTLSVEDSSFLIRRFEQLANESADKKTDAWI